MEAQETTRYYGLQDCLYWGHDFFWLAEPRPLNNDVVSMELKDVRLQETKQHDLATEWALNPQNRS